MSKPAGILTNELTGRYHPIVFRRAPLPSEGSDESKVQRHKSIGHHTDGFDTVQQAQDHIASQPDWSDTGSRWSWDGVNIPALIHWF